MPYLLQVPQWFDDDGDPLAGGYVEFYEGGTDTPSTTAAYPTYADAVAATNTLGASEDLDSNGRPDTSGSIWLADKAIKIKVYDSEDVQVGSDVDNLMGSGGLIQVGSGNAMDITILADNTAKALTFLQGSNDYLNFCTTDSGEGIDAGNDVQAFYYKFHGASSVATFDGEVVVTGELNPDGGIHDIGGQEGCSITASLFTITIEAQSGGVVIRSDDGLGNYEFAMGDLDIKNGTVSCSDLTASLPVFSDASKNLVSNAMTGTGNVVMSASPTLTGTITAAAATLSGLLTTSANIFLPDNIYIALGNTSGSPDATIRWNTSDESVYFKCDNASTVNSFIFEDVGGNETFTVKPAGTEVFNVDSTGIDVTGNITLDDTAAMRIIETGATNGIQICSSPLDLMGLWGATPIARPTTAVYGVWTTLANVVSALQAAGILGA